MPGIAAAVHFSTVSHDRRQSAGCNRSGASSTVLNYIFQLSICRSDSSAAVRLRERPDPNILSEHERASVAASCCKGSSISFCPNASRIKPREGRNSYEEVRLLVCWFADAISRSRTVERFGQRIRFFWLERVITSTNILINNEPGISHFPL